MSPLISPCPARPRTGSVLAAAGVASLLVLTSTAGATASGAAGVPTAARAASSTGTSVPAAPPSAGATAAPLRTVPVTSSVQLSAALAAALPGDQISLASGTYTGPFVAAVSGTADHPVVVTPAPGATVRLTASLPYPACGKTGPDESRTLEFIRGASHWVVQGLTINGGLMIAGKNADVTMRWQTKMVNTKNWQARRAIPGAATNDPVAARDAVAYLAAQTRQTLLPSDDIQLIGNTVTGKGIFGRLARFGVLQGNTVTDIACGAGPGVWLSNFSTGWLIDGNDVSHVAHSTASHYMQEGIRVGNGSNYGVIQNNTVHDLDPVAHKGRGITTDQDSSWNVIQDNTSTNNDIGFNEEMSGWGNIWRRNTASNNTTAGFSFRMEDLPLTSPSKDTSSQMAQVSCNLSTGAPRALQVGAMADGAFTNNAFGPIFLGKQITRYWTSVGNTYDGSTTPPVSRSSAPTTPPC